MIATGISATPIAAGIKARTIWSTPTPLSVLEESER